MLNGRGRYPGGTPWIGARGPVLSRVAIHSVQNAVPCRAGTHLDPKRATPWTSRSPFLSRDRRGLPRSPMPLHPDLSNALRSGRCLANRKARRDPRGSARSRLERDSTICSKVHRMQLSLPEPGQPRSKERWRARWQGELPPERFVGEDSAIGRFLRALETSAGALSRHQIFRFVPRTGSSREASRHWLVAQSSLRSNLRLSERNRGRASLFRPVLRASLFATDYYIRIFEIHCRIEDVPLHILLFNRRL